MSESCGFGSESTAANQDDIDARFNKRGILDTRLPKILGKNSRREQEVEFRYDSVSSCDFEDDQTIIFVMDLIDESELESLEQALSHPNKLDKGNAISLIASKLTHANKEN